MHEQRLMRVLVRRVVALAEERPGTGVSRVVIRAGALGPGDADHLREHFALAARDTLAEGAELVVVRTHELVDLLLERVELEGDDR
ncbi:MAG: hydrogenase maturation nickel metallochaperone HypA [Chloroflexi bacterium]|nr:hydrogenase maturation nickel metallochaperone HypA [Chloroflexota bacterium]